MKPVILWLCAIPVVASILWAFTNLLCGVGIISMIVIYGAPGLLWSLVGLIPVVAYVYMTDHCRDVPDSIDFVLYSATFQLMVVFLSPFLLPSVFIGKNGYLLPSPTFLLFASTLLVGAVTIAFFEYRKSTGSVSSGY